MKEYYGRMRCAALESKITTASQAALLVKNGMIVATSGFTSIGYPKAVPHALAMRAKGGEHIGITLITGASVGPEIDMELTEAGVIERRYPYQSNKTLRSAINDGVVRYADMHLSSVPMFLRSGIFGKVDLAIIEAVCIDEDGNIYLSGSSGISNAALSAAEGVIVEINRAVPLSYMGLHDVYGVALPPDTQPIPLTQPNMRIGTSYLPCSPDKIVAVVFTDILDSPVGSKPIDEAAKKMAKNLIGFLEGQVAEKCLPKNLLPLQFGVGQLSNAVLSGFLDSDFEHMQFYSEVVQDAALDLMDAGKVDFASATALALTRSRNAEFNKNIDRYRDRIVLRPMEISNHPEVIRRLGVIAVNTAIEADIYGNVNSSHICGAQIMNGIGGSGDFARNAFISIFITGSTAKKGCISAIVPSVSHVDHSEHDVQVLVTEQGVADLRGLAPLERAHVVIKNCAHPKFRPMLNEYLMRAQENSRYHHVPVWH